MSSRQYNLRIYEDDRKLFDRAAAKEDLKLAQWIRRVLLKEARRILGLV